MKKSKSLAKSEHLSLPQKKKKKKMRRKGSKLFEPTTSSMLKQSVARKGKKKSVKNMNDWINGLRSTKAPPKRAKSKSAKKKGKGKGVSIKHVANQLRAKFIKQKKAASKKKKKPISKSRSKAKSTRGKSKKKGKTVGKKTKKKKSTTVAKKKKKVVKKKKKKQEPEPEPEVQTNLIMLGGNDQNDDTEENPEGKMRNFVQELKIENEPEMINLKFQVAGDIDRENQVEAGQVFKDKPSTGFELESSPGIHLEYNTGEMKLAFGPEDQLIEHIFTMHWSQVDKILIRAKVNANLAPPSKRMTIMEAGTDIYSKQRNMVVGEDNLQNVEIISKSFSFCCFLLLNLCPLLTKILPIFNIW